MTLFKRFQTNRLLAAVFSIVVGVALGAVLEHANVMNIVGLLKWLLGLGVFIILWLHGKSFFSTDHLGWYYTRLYGAGFGLIYTTAVFWLFAEFYAGQHNEAFNIAAYGTVLSTVIYNFITNNYAGIEKDHLLARVVLEKQMKQDEAAKRKRAEQVKTITTDSNNR